MRPRIVAIALASLTWATLACGSEDAASPSAASPAKPSAPPPAAVPAPPPAAGAAAAAKPAVTTPDSLPNGIVLALAQFKTEPGQEGKPAVVPGAARLEFLVRRDGEWQMTALEDGDSNVFHKAMIYDDGGPPRLLSLGGTAGMLKLWTPSDAGLVSSLIWEKDFGGKFSRMRDAEVADLYGDGKATIAIATHDQGVVAVARPTDTGFEVVELDHKENTFVHEVEVGDLDGDGVLELYATPSEPNRLDGTPQSGEVVRYVPARGEGPTVVAALGDRHAKEILVEDVDGDGRDELYVSVEGETEGRGATKKVKTPVEIRRYEADTPADAGVVIGTLEDALSRFLTAGDVDGDGRKELVAAAFSSGVWMFRPGEDPNTEWKRELVDRDSAGFEHASIFADLDGDGVDELYVASDRHKEVRRYVWDGSKLVRETIYVRPDDRPIFTWNLMPFPAELAPEG